MLYSCLSGQPAEIFLFWQVELPLGATEDRICGTIDVEKALQEGVKAYEPGLLVSRPASLGRRQNLSAQSAGRTLSAFLIQSKRKPVRE